jgi:Tat protein secretion system quality control protein TatD with DNase activity
MLSIKATVVLKRTAAAISKALKLNSLPLETDRPYTSRRAGFEVKELVAAYRLIRKRSWQLRRYLSTLLHVEIY